MDTAPTIPYATAPKPTGVSVERDAHHLTVTVPPPPNWRALGRGYFWTVVLLLIIVLFVGFSLATSPGDRWEILPSMIIWGSALAGAFAFGLLRLHRWTTFMVTADRFLITTRVGTGRGRTTSWRRGRIVAAKYSKIGSRLILRIIGRDWLELALGHDPGTMKSIAQTLDEALHASFAPVREVRQLTPVPPLPEPTYPVMRPFTRLCLGVAAIAFGILCLVYPVLLIAVIVVAIPLGIWFGTQDKEFYT
jgi:hypothetical protein